MTDLNTWNERYRAGRFPGPGPDRFLVRAKPYIERLLPDRGAALDLAGGAGRNARWLSGLGFDVTLVDFSTVAARKARTRAVRIVVADLEKGEYTPPPVSFDLVAVFFYLHRPLLPAIAKAVKPGGLLIYRTYLEGRPGNPDYLLRSNELLKVFRGFRVLVYEETLGLGPRAVAGLLAQRRAMEPQRHRDTEQRT
jgi:SAM-dependent methyltransferase